MNHTRLTSLALIASLSTAALAAHGESDQSKLQIYPKNLARQHMGTNLFVFNAANQTYVPTEAAAAWLDDDVVTGWPPMAGKQYYLMTLAEPQLISNFCISGRSAQGTITLYGGDQAAVPGAASWTPLARDIPADSVNEKKMDKSFSRFAKYILIETNLENPGPWYSIYAYGEQSAVSYDLQRRDRTIDTQSVFGPYVNLQTSMNVAGLYANGLVTYSNGTAGYVGWQKAIDDNPQSGISIAPSRNQSGLVIQFDKPRTLERISILTDTSARGRLDFFVVNDTQAAVGPDGNESQYIKAANTSGSAGVGQAASLQDLTPSVSMVLDGSNSRSNIEFPPASGQTLLARWTPETAGQPINLREIDTFGEPTLASYELSRTPDSIAELGTQGDGKDYKDFADYKGGGKEVMDPVAEGPMALRAPFLPGALGFPPNLTAKKTPPPRSLSP